MKPAIKDSQVPLLADVKITTSQVLGDQTLQNAESAPLTPDCKAASHEAVLMVDMSDNEKSDNDLQNSPTIWPETLSPPLQEFLKETELKRESLQQAGIPLEILQALLNRSNTGHILRWLALEDTLVKITQFPFLDERGIQHEQISSEDEKCSISLSEWINSRVWPNGKALPFKSEAMLKRAYGVDQFYSGSETIITRFWTLFLISFWGNDLYFYQNPGSYICPTLHDIFFTQSGNERALITTLSRPDHWYAATAFFGMPLLWGITKALYVSCQQTQLLDENELIKMQRLFDHYQPHCYTDIFSWLLPFNSLSNAIDTMRRVLLWNNRLTSQQRLRLFESFLKFAQRSSKLTQWNALDALSDIADGLSMQDFIRLKKLDVEEDVLQSFLQIKIKAFVELQRSAKQLPLQPHDKSLYLRYLKPLLRFLIANFLLWCLGQPQSNKLQPLFYLTKAFKLYIKINFSLLVYNGIQQAVNYYNQKKNCEEEGKLWLYMNQVADDQCTVCGNLPIFYKNVFNISSCLTNYLHVPRTPQQIVDVLRRAKPDDDILTLDLSNQLFPDAENGLAVVIPAIKTYLPQLNYLILSAGNYVPTPSIGPVGAHTIAKHLADWSLTALSLAKQTNIGSNGTIYLAQGLPGATLQHLDLSQTNGNDQSGEFLLEQVAFSNMTSLKLSGNLYGNLTAFATARALSTSASLTNLWLDSNQIPPAGATQIARAIPSSSLKYLDITQNPTGAAVNNFLQNIANSSLQVFSIGGIAFTDNLNITALTQALKSSTLTSLSLVRCNIGSNVGPNGELAVQVIAEALKNSSLTSLILSYNGITANDTAVLAPSLLKLIKLDVAYNPIGAGVVSIAQMLPNSSLQVLILFGAGVDDDGVIALSQAFSASNLMDLGLSVNHDIGPKGACALGEALSRSAQSLPSLSIDLNDNNKIGDIGGMCLARGASNTRRQAISIYLDGIGCGDNTAIAFSEAIRSGHLRFIAVEVNKITSVGATALANAFPGSPFQGIELDYNNIGSGIQAIANALTIQPPTPHPLWITIFDPQARRVVTQPQSNTNLTNFWSQANNLNTTDAVALCRAIPYTDISIQNLYLQDNPNIDPNVVDIRTCVISAASSLQPPLALRLFYKLTQWTIYPAQQSYFYLRNQLTDRPVVVKPKISIVEVDEKIENDSLLESAPTLQETDSTLLWQLHNYTTETTCLPLPALPCDTADSVTPHTPSSKHNDTVAIIIFMVLALYAFYRILQGTTQTFASLIHTPDDKNKLPLANNNSKASSGLGFITHWWDSKTSVTTLQGEPFKKACKQLTHALLKVDHDLKNLDKQYSQLSRQTQADIERIRFYWLEHAEIVEGLRSANKATKKEIAELRAAISELKTETDELVAELPKPSKPATMYAM